MIAINDTFIIHVFYIFIKEKDLRKIGQYQILTVYATTDITLTLNFNHEHNHKHFSNDRQTRYGAKVWVGYLF